MDDVIVLLGQSPKEALQQNSHWLEGMNVITMILRPMEENRF